MKRQRIGAGQSDEPGEGPGSEQGAELPVLGRDDVVRVVPAMMVAHDGYTACAADDQKSEEEGAVERIAAQRARDRDDGQRRDGRAEYGFGCAVERTNQFKIECLVGNRAIQPIGESGPACENPHAPVSSTVSNLPQGGNSVASFGIFVKEHSYLGSKNKDNEGFDRVAPNARGFA